MTRFQMHRTDTTPSPVGNPVNSIKILNRTGLGLKHLVGKQKSGPVCLATYLPGNRAEISN